jgi:putative glutamine amidotransferase
MSFILASWVRQSDDAPFDHFLSAHPEIALQNARTLSQSPALEEAHGLLITGGPDISAAFHGEPVRDESLIRDPEPERDAWEFAALQSALSRGLPIFCICKGFQVLNVALGGTLQLHIEGHDWPELRDGNLQALRHSTLARHRFALVNSSHHQALDRVGDGLEIEAWSQKDDIIEQVRLRDYPFCLAVQYHPERSPLYTPLFEDFFAALKG